MISYSFPFFSSIRFLFSFSTTHVYPYISILSLFLKFFFLSLLSPWFQNLPLFFSSSSVLTFLFLFSFLFGSLHSRSRPWSFDFSSMFTFLFFVFFLLHLTSLAHTTGRDCVCVLIVLLFNTFERGIDEQRREEERERIDIIIAGMIF